MNPVAKQFASELVAGMSCGYLPEHGRLVSMAMLLGGSSSCVNLSADKLNQYIMLLLIASL